MFALSNLRRKTNKGKIRNLKVLSAACQYLHFARTEDSWFKSALYGVKGGLLTSGSYLRLKEKLATSTKFWGVRLIII